MRRNYALLAGAALMLLTTACGPKLHRYSCGGRKRCISQNEKIDKTQKTEKQVTVAQKQNTAVSR